MDKKKSYIFSDISSGKPCPIVLRQSISEPGQQNNQEDFSGNVLDLSTHSEISILTPSAQPLRPRRLEDIRNESPEIHPFGELDSLQEVFLQIDEKHYRQRNKGAELVRIAAVGMIMLGLLHGMNIYKRGLILKDSVVASASEGYQSLLAGGQKAQAIDLGNAGTDFQSAATHFNDALEAVRFLNANQNLLLSREKTVQSVQAILSAGKTLSEAGTDFIDVLQKLQTFPQSILEPISHIQNLEAKSPQSSEQNLQPGSQNSWDANPSISETQNTESSLTEELKKDLEILGKAQGKLEVAADYFSLIDKSILPLNLQSKFISGQQKLQQLLAILASAQQQIPVFLKLLGDRYPHRYLILLQNDTEARPTGGFIGSYLIVDFNDGRIETMELKDVYETDGQLKGEKGNIPSPEDIAKISKNWRLRDANYSPDFAISGEKAAWFLQKEGGPSVDTVIALNQSFLANLFEVTGPITLEGLSAPLTKENYQTILSYIIESKLSGDQDPKKILREFIPAFQKKLFTSGSLQKTLKILLSGLQQKSLLLYSRDEEIQKFFDHMGFTGKILPIQPGEDYLDVINTSIGGNKSDVYIKQSIVHNSQIDTDGTVTDEVGITREHLWNDASAKKLKQMLKEFGFTQLSSTVEFILGAGKNKSVVKVYVPLGSTLVSASMAGQNIAISDVAVREDKDLHKTYFMLEMDIDPGQSKTITLTYQLPQKLNLDFADSYKLFIQKQAGLVVSSFQKNIFLKPGLNFYAQYPEVLPSANQKNVSVTNESAQPTQTSQPTQGPNLPQNTPQQSKPAWIRQNQAAHLERTLDQDFHLAVLIGR